MTVEYTRFDLKPRLRRDGRHLQIGFFESACEEAWITVDDKFADDRRYWTDLASCLKFHCRTLRLFPNNSKLARELQEYYAENKGDKIRAGRPQGGHRTGVPAGGVARTEPQGTGGSDGVS